MSINNPNISIPRFSAPSIYQVIVQGAIKSESADRLKGMQIIQKTNSLGSPISVLTGQVSDQTALTGILNTLYDMHMIVLSVNLLRVEGNI